MEEREKERGEVGCKLAANLGTKTKRSYERDMWPLY